MTPKMFKFNRLVKPASLIFASSVIFLTSQVHGQNSTSQSQLEIQKQSGNQAVQSSTQKIEKKESLLSRFKLEFGLEHSQNVSVDELSRRSSSLDLGFGLMFKVNDNSSLFYKSALSRSNTPPNDTEMSDSIIGLSIKGYEITEQFRTSHALLSIIPTSEKSQKENRLFAGVGMSNGLSYSTDFITTSYSLSVARNFHEYDFNADGLANIQYSLGHKVELSIAFAEKWSFVNSGTYKTAWTYANKQRFAFEYHSDLVFDASDKMSLNLGTSNVGNALKANGQDSNIKVYDENTSILRAGLNFNI